MFFKAALFDLDNTLYNYNDCHDHALQTVLNAIGAIYSVPVEELKASYTVISIRLKAELGHTAACHSRFIYFKQLATAHGIPLAEVQTWHDLYWRTFYEAMRVGDGVRELLSLLRSRKIKTVLLSDFLIQQQFEKLAALGILDFFDDIITSEEIGVEKPNSKMFLSALARTGQPADQTVMVGDSYTKDIAGAAACGIHGFWINPAQPAPSIAAEFSSFPSIAALHEWLLGLDGELYRLEQISRFCGERFDLTQGAGGNISVKYGDCLCIKSSGQLLSDVTRCKGYSALDNSQLCRDIAASVIGKVDRYSLFTKARASIETYMHALLDRYTVHLHPVQVNAILTRDDGQEVIRSLFPDSLVLDYIAPGFGIAEALRASGDVPQVVFLMNHGLIVSSDDFDELFDLIDRILHVCEVYLGRDFTHYQASSRLSALLNGITGLSHICYLCEDEVIGHGLPALDDIPALFPDSVVYCGTKVLKMDDLAPQAVKAHLALHGVPKLVTHAGRLYIYDQSLKKCRDTESVLKSVVLLAADPKRMVRLSDAEVAFINGWEAEAYRKMLQT